jgi:endonuclease/exonuclease/phosphatase family metal-dependent hydrolase
MRRRAHPLARNLDCESQLAATRQSFSGNVALHVLVILFLLGAVFSLSLSIYDPALEPRDASWDLPAVSAANMSTSLGLLTFVTMNIAGLEPSQSAPDAWRTDRTLQEEAVVAEILRTNPDVIALQECPTVDWAEHAFHNRGDLSYRLMGSASSHAGYVSLLIRQDLHAAELVLAESLPMVAVEILWNGHSVAIASVHLAPFEQNSFVREKEVEELLEACQGGSEALLFMGDMNMRDKEDDRFEALGLVDAWKRAGANEAARYSWDTTSHTDDESHNWQNLYYGASTRAYQRRYDRVYATERRRGGTSAVSFRFNVPSFALIANQPIAPSRYHFLSDHFGITGQLELAWDK